MGRRLPALMPGPGATIGTHPQPPGPGNNADFQTAFIYRLSSRSQGDARRTEVLHAATTKPPGGGSDLSSPCCPADAGACARRVAQQLVGDARRGSVYRVVEGVDRDLPRRPEDDRWGDVQRGQGDLRAPPYGGAMGEGRGARREADGIKQSAHDSPPGAVAPVRQVVETRAGDVILEGLDPQRFGRRSRRRGTWLPVPEPRLDRARDGHGRGPGQASHQSLADAAGHLFGDAHDSISWSCPSGAGSLVVLACAP